MPGYQAFNDVWSAGDGVHWTEVTAAAPWPARLWFSAAVYRGRMWVLGGWSRVPETNWGEAWFSRDGKEWTQLASTVTWKARHEHSAFVFRDKLWIAGGCGRCICLAIFSPPNDSDDPTGRPDQVVYSHKTHEKCADSRAVTRSYPSRELLHLSAIAYSVARPPRRA